MPPEAGVGPFDGRLETACASLGLTVSIDVRSRLLTYLSMIARWNQVYNLTAFQSADEMFTHHLLDCLAAIPSLDRWASGDQETLSVLDVGSGAGLPGIVLALVRPAWRVTCVDSVSKKATFIRQVKAELGVSNLQAVHGRVESPDTWEGRRFDLVISRAFASLADLIDMTRGILAEHGIWVAMKGALSGDERRNVPDDVEMFHVEQLKVPELDARRCLAWLRLRSTSLVSADTSRPTGD